MPGRCPICREQAKKISTVDRGDIHVRCNTDGDFLITPRALKKIDGVSYEAREQALDRAILEKQPRQLPRIRRRMILEPGDGDPSGVDSRA